MTDTLDKTALYEGVEGIPPLVAKAVALARHMGFPSSCTPYQGELLRLLARGREGGLIGETGTGCGVGLAWMMSAVDLTTSLISIEIDDARARACQQLFANYANVEVLRGDWREIIPHGPFDLLVLDGGGVGKRKNDLPADPSTSLKPGGTVVLDDFHPPMTHWPVTESNEDQLGGDLNRSRAYWFNHPDLLTTEVRVHPDVSTLVGVRRGTYTLSRN